jgi:para-nitrobenzyl esterase
MMARIETSKGFVRGVDHDGIQIFKGIPYAEAPMGSLRFAAPVPHSSWAGDLACHDFGSISHQPIDPLSVLIPGCEWNFYSPKSQQSEDCLNLNVWTPSSTGSRPVLFWIHGGAFLTGSGTGAWTDGEAFARDHDVVVVTINYRLGALGFLALDDPTSAPGVTSNNGLRDQVAALEWVRENIAAFGGDPSRVCIFGESAGGMSVATHLGSPASQGLFSTAIIQSGHHGLHHSMESATAVTQTFLSKFEGLTGDPLEFLRGLDVKEIMRAQGELTQQIALPFTMVVDGHSLPVPIIDTVASGAVSMVQLIVGTNTNENRLFTAMGGGLGRAPQLLEERLRGLMKPEIATSETAMRAVADLAAVYESEGYGGEDLWETLTNDRMWRAPVRELLDTFVGAGGTAFSYQFGFESPVRGGELRACHAMEIPFVFDNLTQPGVTEFTGDAVGEDSSAHKLSKLMNECWAHFAATGHPTDVVEEWPPYTPGNPHQMFFSDSSEVRIDPNFQRISWWKDQKPFIETMDLRGTDR